MFIVVGVTYPAPDILSVMSVTLWNAFSYSYFAFLCSLVLFYVVFGVLLHSVSCGVTTSKDKMHLGVPVAVSCRYLLEIFMLAHVLFFVFIYLFIYLISFQKKYLLLYAVRRFAGLSVLLNWVSG